MAKNQHSIDNNNNNKFEMKEEREKNSIENSHTEPTLALRSL